jgi:hypothetical protein
MQDLVRTLFAREQLLLPQSQSVAATQLRNNAITNEITALRAQSKAHRLGIEANTKTITLLKQEKGMILPPQSISDIECTVASCRGYLVASGNHCGICHGQACHRCRTHRTHGHVCDPEVVAAQCKQRLPAASIKRCLFCAHPKGLNDQQCITCKEHLHIVASEPWQTQCALETDSVRRQAMVKLFFFVSEGSIAVDQQRRANLRVEFLAKRIDLVRWKLAFRRLLTTRLVLDKWRSKTNLSMQAILDGDTTAWIQIEVHRTQCNRLLRRYHQPTISTLWQFQRSVLVSTSS